MFIITDAFLIVHRSSFEGQIVGGTNAGFKFLNVFLCIIS